MFLSAVIFGAFLVHVTLQNPPLAPLTPYVTPFEFCSKLPSGDYCNPSFPRSFVNCPNGIETYCPPNMQCAVGNETGTVECVLNYWNPINQLCIGKPEDASYCFQNMTVECDGGEMFLCPSDLVCKKRGTIVSIVILGRRAYCVKPQFQFSEPTSGLCNGLSKSGKICHPLNLKKIISCPSEETSICPPGQMCVVSDNASEATCASFIDDLSRFCSNKPLHSSFCFSNSGGKFVLCSNVPQIVECPSGKCRQHFGITAECV